MGVRVLIVDDLEQIRHDLRNLLPLLGDVDVVGEASNGQEAVSLAISLEPQIIIMDVEMPGMNGLDAARIIKKQVPNTRIAMLTIHDDPTTRQQATNAGADYFLVKGAHLPEFFGTIFSQ